MLDYLYPRIYFSPDGDEEGGGEDSDYGGGENGGVDDYTGLPLSEDDAVGDHDIPRSWGIALGGVTEYSNLKVTTAFHNNKKLNRNGDQYIQYLKERGVI